MRTEERLRETLPTLVRGETAGEDLWAGIEQRLAHRPRRVLTGRVLAVAAVAAFAAMLIWAARVNRESPVAPSVHELAVTHVQLIAFPEGGPAGVAKVYAVLVNRADSATGAALTCEIRDAADRVLGTSHGSVEYVAPHGHVPIGPIGFNFRGSPTSAACHASPQPAVSPTPPEPPPPEVDVPSSVAFWDPEHGLLVGQYTGGGCTHRCSGFIEVTADGGRTWRPVYRNPAGAVTDVTVLEPDVAWAVAEACRGPRCPSRLLFTEDGGRTWGVLGDQPVAAPSFPTPTIGYAIRPSTSGTDPTARLTSTTDGGRTWTTLVSPCPNYAYQATAISFVTAERGWLLCVGEGAAGAALKAVLETDDAATSWHVVSSAAVGDQQVGRGLEYNAFPTDVLFLPDGHGWLSQDQGSLLATDDGGHTWRSLGVGTPLDASAHSAWFVSDTRGFALKYLAGVYRLLSTTDGGESWRAIRSWRLDD